MSPAPSNFDGSWLDLYRKHIEPNLPQPELVQQFHEWLVEYCRSAGQVFPVRAVRGAERRKTYPTSDGTIIAPTDNSPAWVVHALLMEKRLSRYQDFKKLICNMPTHMFDIPKVTRRTANALGWYVAHIYPAKNGDINFRSWTRGEVERRFLLSLHPCNLFLMPLPNRQSGEDAHVIAFIADQFATRYHSTWAKFLACVQVAPLARNPAFGSRPVRPDQSSFGSASPNKGSHGGQRSVSADRREAVSYRSKRLTFKRDRIEPLAPNEQFEVVTPMGVYRFTKQEFHLEFRNIVTSKSYLEGGSYHGKELHLKAARFRVADSQ
jgi:hypothetical protein